MAEKSPDEVFDKIAEFLRVSRDRVTADIALTDLVADSFRLVELAIEIQEEFGIVLRQADLQPVVTAGDLANLVVARKQS